MPASPGRLLALTRRVAQPQQAAAQGDEQLVPQPQALPGSQQLHRAARAVCCHGHGGRRRLRLCRRRGRHQQQRRGCLVVQQGPREDVDQRGKEAVADAQRDELR